MTAIDTLASVCTEIVDCEHKTAPIDEHGEYFAVGTPAMRGNVINYDEARRITKETFVSWTRRLTPREGDLLFAREAPVGPIVKIPALENVAPGQRTVLLRPDPRAVDSDYLYYLLSSPKIQARLGSRAAGSTVPHLNVADVREFVLPPLPTVAQQRAIAEVLGALDDKIAANTKLAETAMQIAVAHFQAMVREAGESRSLRDCMSLEYGKALPASSRVTDGAALVYGSGGVVGRHDTPMVDTAGVVVGRKGTAGAVYWAPGPHFPIDTTFYVKPADGIPAVFCFFALKALRLTELNSDSAVPGLNRNEAYAQPIRMPSRPALERFDSAASALFRLSSARETESSCLAKTRDLLLPALMSGKIRVKDAERVVEEVV